MKKFLSLMLAVSLIMTFAGSMLASAATITLGKKGDANEDGKISIVDVVLMRAHIVGSATLEGNKFILADINEDGKVNIVDVVMARSAIVTQADLGDKTTEEEVTDTETTDTEAPSTEFATLGRYEFENATMEDNATSYVPSENVTPEETSNGMVAKFADGKNRAYFELNLPAGTYEVKFVAIGLGTNERKIQFYVDKSYSDETASYEYWTDYVYEVELTEGVHKFGAKSDGAWGWEWEWLYVDYMEISLVEETSDTEEPTTEEPTTEEPTTEEPTTEEVTDTETTDTEAPSTEFAALGRYEFENATMEDNATSDVPSENVTPEETSNGMVAKFADGKNRAYFELNLPAGTYEVKFVAIGLGTNERKIQFYVDKSYSDETVSYEYWTDYVYEVELTEGVHKFGAKSDGAWGWEWEWLYVDYMEISLVEETSDTEEPTTEEPTTEEPTTEEPTTEEPTTEEPTTEEPTTEEPDTEVSADIPSGVIGDFKTDWFTTAEGDDVPSTVSSVEELSNGGLRVNIDLEAETYTYLTNFPSGLDLTDYSTLSLVVTNPNANSIQIQPIFKVGTAWTWTEYDQYKEIPANTTTVLTFDMSGCATRNNVMAVIFRIQSGSVKFAGNVDILSMGYDLPANAYANEIAEINRPKSADAFTWAYPESDWTAKTTSTTVENGVITVGFSGISTTAAAGVQTETKPGLGTGLDCSDYSTLTCTITNNSADDIHITLVLKTGGGWLWQENGGVVVGSDENERIIAAGETVDVTYYLNGSTWKSADSNWAYSGTLSGAEDVRAIAFKIYTGDSETATGSVEISNFAFNF